MQQTGNSLATTPAIRLGNTAVDIAISNTQGSYTFIHHIINTENDYNETVEQLLKEHADAFAQCHKPIPVLFDRKYLTIPADEFQAEQAETLYRYALTDDKDTLAQPLFLPQLSTYILFAIPDNLLQLINKLIPMPQLQPIAVPLWRHTAQHRQAKAADTLYAYTYDGNLEIYAIKDNRLKFANRFPAAHPHDILYYILFVWEQLGMQHHIHQLHLLGTLPQEEWLTDRLRTFILHVTPHADQQLYQQSNTQPATTLPADILAAITTCE